MTLIVRIQINSKELRCYRVKRITNIGKVKPTGTTNLYQVTECYSDKLIGHVTHNYDDSPEKLVIKALKLIK
jgi:hypothetical protein